MQKTVLQQQKFLLLSALFLVCFLVVDLLRGAFSSVNLNVDLWAASVNSNFFRLPAEVISTVFDTTVELVVSVLVAVLLFVLHHKRYGLLLLCSMGGTALLVGICKTIIASPRPLNEVILETNFSFPSGHVASTIALLGIFSYIVWNHWKTLLARALTVTVYFSVTVLVGFDRIYLNVHWLSDVIGAVFLGAFWLAFVVYMFNLARTHKASARKK